MCSSERFHKVRKSLQSFCTTNKLIHIHSRKTEGRNPMKILKALSGLALETVTKKTAEVIIKT